MNVGRLRPKARMRSFLCALRGVGYVLRTQPNAWIMVAAAACTFAAGLILRVSRIEWCLLITAICLVIAAEIFNTALESLTDLVSPEYHPLAGRAKDAAAGAVLVSAFLALAIGILV